MLKYYLNEFGNEAINETNYLYHVLGKLQCNETSTLKRTILQNPSTFPDSCSYRIESYDSKVCQLRIDFDMILAQPTFPENSTVGSPRCLQDSLSIGDLVLCGVNMKQHGMIMDLIIPTLNLNYMKLL